MADKEVNMTEQKPKATRDGFGEGLVELAKTNKDVVVVSADLTESTRASWFKEIAPERFFAIGIAEQDMFGAAAGLALCGKTAFACTFAVFASGRAWDQVRISLCYMNLDVKIGATHGGISVGPDGATHQALEDIAIMRALPNMKVIVPADAYQAKKATIAAVSLRGPVYIRTGRSAVPYVTSAGDDFKLGKADVLQEGKNVAIIACGVMVKNSLEAAKILSAKGISAMIINMHTIKPIDADIISSAAQQTGAIVTCEEHSVIGGLGGAVAEVVAKKGPVVPVEMVGVNDVFGESGQPDELMKKYRLTPEDIVIAALKAIKRKK